MAQTFSAFAAMERFAVVRLFRRQLIEHLTDRNRARPVSFFSFAALSTRPAF